MAKRVPDSVSFRTPAALRAWFRANHRTAPELLLCCYKQHAADRGVTYRQALDEALCYGWIDGITRRLDADTYCVRFTPRRPRSIWSKVNVGHVERLTKAGRMTKAGLAAFAARDEGRTGVYSFENRPAALEPAFEQRFRANRAAWAWYQEQAPWYRRTTAFWVMSAKKPETRERRLAALIDCCARGVVVGPLKFSRPS